jgi:heptosyltransferase-2
MKLLVRATNWVGDAIISVPALRLIRETHPDANITVLARPWVAELYTRENFCDEVILYRRDREHNGVSGLLRLASELRAGRFDCALLLQNAFDAAVLVWLAGIPRRIGYNRDGRGWLLTDAVPVPKPGEIPSHQRYYYLELLRRAGFVQTLPPCPEIRIYADPEQGRRLFERWGVRGERVLGVSPGAAFGSAKRWIPERFAEAAAGLAREWEAEIALFGSGAERAVCEAIREKLGGRAHSLAGQTSLSEFIDLAAACCAFVTNDSGAMHIAAAVGAPTVAVFGPTKPDATGPASALARVVRTPVECSPCEHRDCPLDHRCMTRVEAATVVAEARRLVSLSIHGHAN